MTVLMVCIMCMGVGMGHGFVRMGVAETGNRVQLLPNPYCLSLRYSVRSVMPSAAATRARWP